MNTRPILLIRAAVRRPQYGLRALLLFVTVVSVPLAYWGSREHAYRVRQAAVDTLLAQEHASVHLAGAYGDGWWDYRLSSETSSRRLRRDDVVVYVGCRLSDKAADAILRLPTITGLNVYDGGGDPGNRAPLGTMDPYLRKIARLPALEELSVSGSVSDVGMGNLKSLSENFGSS